MLDNGISLGSFLPVWPWRVRVKRACRVYSVVGRVPLCCTTSNRRSLCRFRHIFLFSFSCFLQLSSPYTLSFLSILFSSSHPHAHDCTNSKVIQRACMYMIYASYIYIYITQLILPVENLCTTIYAKERAKRSRRHGKLLAVDNSPRFHRPLCYWHLEIGNSPGQNAPSRHNYVVITKHD